MEFNEETYKELVTEYGDAVADVVSAQEWGTGVATATLRKEEAFNALLEYVKKFTKKEEAPK